MIAAEGDEESEEDKVTSTSDRFLKRISDLPDNEKESLCLFAYPDGTWQVKMPSEQVPTELPEPSLGINSAWDGMERKQWLFLVANHRYSWLLALASYFASRSGFQKNERKKLFQMINDLPTIYEVVEMKQKEPSGSPKRTRSKSSKKTVYRTMFQEEKKKIFYCKYQIGLMTSPHQHAFRW